MAHVMTASIPKYQVIKEHVLQGITNRRFTHLLPSENRLADKFGVSRMTARRALEELQKEGFAVRTPGKGTFVKERLFTQGHFRVRSARKHAQELNLPYKTRLLELRALSPPPKIAGKLSNPEQVVLVRRLHYFGDKPVHYEKRYLCEDLCGGILWEDLEVDSIHEILVVKYKLPLTKVWQQMDAVVLSEEVAFLFDVNPGYPAFHIERITYTNEKPVTWVEYFIRGEIAFEDLFSPQQNGQGVETLSY